jgi:hypothetical protein
MLCSDINALSECAARKCMIRLQFSSNACNLNKLKLTPKDRNQTSMSLWTKKQETGPNKSKANLLCMCRPSYCTTTSSILFSQLLERQTKVAMSQFYTTFSFLFFSFFSPLRCLFSSAPLTRQPCLELTVEESLPPRVAQQLSQSSGVPQQSLHSLGTA